MSTTCANSASTIAGGATNWPGLDSSKLQIQPPRLSFNLVEYQANASKVDASRSNSKNCHFRTERYQSRFIRGQHRLEQQRYRCSLPQTATGVWNEAGLDIGGSAVRKRPKNERDDHLKLMPATTVASLQARSRRTNSPISGKLAGGSSWQMRCQAI